MHCVRTDNKARLSLHLLVLIVLAATWVRGQNRAKTADPAETKPPAMLWADPGNIAGKDLFNGPGGTEDRPKLPVKFIKEDKHGHNSKLDVEDAGGQKWRAKLGIEAQPETVATRLLWAVGYNTNINYFVPDLEVQGLPAHLERGQGHVVSADHLEGVRLQERGKKDEKSATWSWKHNPFVGTREFNGLRVMMALISNWDLKDENNTVRSDKHQEKWLVTDVGTAFGSSGVRMTEAGSKNNLKAYQSSKFISKETPAYVDFNFPRHPPLLYIFALPSYIHKVQPRWVGNHVPRADAKWIGSLLSQLSTRQIEDAFRAAGYSSDQITAFTRALQGRITELNNL